MSKKLHQKCTWAQKMLQSLEYKFKKYDLVICDEMGYVSFDMEGAEQELQPPVAKIRKQGHYNTNKPPVHKAGGDHER